MRKARLILATLGMLLVGASALTALSPTPVSAACNDKLLTFPAWYRGLVDGSCEILPVGNAKGAMRVDKFIAKVALNVVEIILQLVAYGTVVFLIKGGFDYMLSQGDANSMTGAKNTILNAVVGLVISLMAVAIVRIIAELLK